jgi:hypothetical protein
VAIRAIDEQGNVGRPLDVPIPGPASGGGVGGSGLLGVFQGDVGRGRPVIGFFSATRRVFAVGRGSTATSARRRRAAARGTTFRYGLSVPATVRIRIERALSGRRVGRRCLAPTRRRRTRARCTRYALAGVLTRRARAGTNATAFTGRIGRRALRTGRYRAVITATNGFGDVSAPRQASFTVVRG